MSTQAIATRLVELIRQGQYDTAQAELYAEDALSVEPDHSPFLKTVHGLEAIKEKSKQFQEQIEEVHGSHISDPLIAGDFFTVSSGIDVTFKGQGRTQIEEVNVYQVKDGKIVLEHFFY